MNSFRSRLFRFLTFGLRSGPKILAPQKLAQRMERDIRLQARTMSSFALLHMSLSRSDNVEALLGRKDCREVTQELIRRLQLNLRAQDYCAFPTPNEVWICLPELSSASVARLAASNFITCLETPISASDRTVTVRPVIGIAVAEQPEISALQMFRTAANAEVRARSLSQRYWTEHADKLLGYSNMELVIAVQSALLHNHLSVAYQPKVELRSGRVVGVEALVRWNKDPHPSTLGPSDIIDIAEQNGMIQDMTRFILNTALREYIESMAELDIGKVWINLSASMLRDSNLASWLQQVVEVWGVDPSLIGFEVTESTLLTDIEQSISTIHALAEYGFQLAIDDFGTGYSSLFYLRRFPVHELKIDKLFVQHMHASLLDSQIVRAIIDLAHNFQLNVVAEGAEDEATLALLKSMGCDQIQGYVFAKAMTVSELREWTTAFSQRKQEAIIVSDLID
jgi:EAL domain-containing protein (putative c-di-GMP-specific phosphodiesterase class I)/GGDEF domain-containing protein